MENTRQEKNLVKPNKTPTWNHLTEATLQTGSHIDFQNRLKYPKFGLILQRKLAFIGNIY